MRPFMSFLTIVLLIISSFSYAKNTDDSQMVKYVFDKFFEGNFDRFDPPLLDQIAKSFLQKYSFSQTFSVVEQLLKFNSTSNESKLCDECQAFYNHFNSLNLTNFESELTTIVEIGCALLKIEKPLICLGAVHEMAPSVLKSFINRYFDPLYACPALSLCPTYYYDLNVTNIADKIIKDTPKIARPLPTLKKTFKVIHISDLHFDSRYVENTNGECTSPDCCRIESGKPTDQSKKAGYWGYLGDCDIPFRTIEAAIRYIKLNLSDQIDFIVWTGDNTNHFIWEQSYESNTNQSILITELLKKELPHIPVFPITGNHESFPVNVYDYFGDHEKKQNDIFATHWESWIGKEGADSYRQSGFYSSLITKYGQPLRIIAVNTQAGNDQNWYLLQNPTDPKQQLKWLKEQLQMAEDNGEKVYIIGHMPTHSLLLEWAQIYTALVQRYSHLILSQFYGHTHKDQFLAFRDQGSENINNVMFITSSLTTYGVQNPSFKIFEIDYDTLLPVNFYTHRMNITYYNLNEIKDINKVNFDLVYDFNSYYGYSDMSRLENFQDLLYKLKSDLPTYQLYFNAFYTGTNNQIVQTVSNDFFCDTNTTPEIVSECYGSPYNKDIVTQIIGTWFSHNPDFSLSD